MIWIWLYWDGHMDAHKEVGKTFNMGQYEYLKMSYGYSRVGLRVVRIVVRKFVVNRRSSTVLSVRKFVVNRRSTMV